VYNIILFNFKVDYLKVFDEKNFGISTWNSEVSGNFCPLKSLKQ